MKVKQPQQEQYFLNPQPHYSIWFCLLKIATVSFWLSGVMGRKVMD